MRSGPGLGTAAGNGSSFAVSHVPSAWSPGSNIGDQKIWLANAHRSATATGSVDEGSGAVEISLPPELERPPVLVRKASGDERSYSSTGFSNGRPAGTLKEALTRKVRVLGYCCCCHDPLLYVWSLSTVCVLLSQVPPFLSTTLLNEVNGLNSFTSLGRDDLMPEHCIVCWAMT